MKHTPWTLEHDDPIKMDELYFLFVYEGEDVVCRISADTSKDCLHRAKLIAAAPTAPHECDDPDCPGNINRKKMEAYPGLLAACKESLLWLHEGTRPMRLMISEAIAKATE